MPDDTCFNEVRAFMDCEEAKRFLQGIRDHLTGHAIDRVDFLNSGEGITTVLRLSNGQCYAFNDEELWLETLREQFSGLFREIARTPKGKDNETMSNRASLERTLFAGNGDNGGWGWRIYDDYFRSFADDHEESEVPTDPFELLTKACAEATPEERQFFEELLTSGKGMLVNGSWHGFEEVEPALRAGLEKED